MVLQLRNAVKPNKQQTKPREKLDPEDIELQPCERFGILTLSTFRSHLSAIKKKKNEIRQFAATWMQLEIIILSEGIQKKKDKYHMIPLICGI